MSCHTTNTKEPKALTLPPQSINPNPPEPKMGQMSHCPTAQVPENLLLMRTTLEVHYPGTDSKWTNYEMVYLYQIFVQPNFTHFSEQKHDNSGYGSETHMKCLSCIYSSNQNHCAPIANFIYWAKIYKLWILCNLKKKKIKQGHFKKFNRADKISGFCKFNTKFYF